MYLCVRCINFLLKCLSQARKVGCHVFVCQVYQLFIEVSTPSQESGLSCMCVSGVSTFYWSVLSKPGKWVVMYLCVRCINFLLKCLSQAMKVGCHVFVCLCQVVFLFLFFILSINHSIKLKNESIIE